jgi:hypothetical protein
MALDSNAPETHPEAVFVVTIHHKHGEDFWIRRSSVSAQAVLLEYVDQWWEHEMGTKRFPKNPQKAIDVYFEEMGDEEYYEIRDAVVED